MKRKLLSILHNGQSKKYGISLLFLIFLTANSAFGATYYIDSVNGLDTNNGTAIATPWKNVSKVNSKTLVAGDKIYLKCGSVWNGQQLKFSGSGSAASPIIVDQYGTGAKPILNGNGLTTANQGVVYLYNQQYIEINNLEITNFPTLLLYANSTAYTVNQIVYNGTNAYQVTVAGTTASSGGVPTHTIGTAISGTVTFSYYCKLTNLSYPDNMFFTGVSEGTINNNPLGADRRGVMIALKDKGTGTAAVANHIYLKNLDIHHIKGQLGNGQNNINGAIPKRTGGIYFTVLNETTGKNSRFNDILIDGCTISYSENTGLAFDNEDDVYYPGGTELALWTARKFTNIKVSNNTIHHIGKNAMIIRCTDETGLIEHNTCYETALGTTGNTMFSARAKGTVFQYNEGYFNRSTTQTVDPGTIDGSMYDPDYGSVGIIFQYSYSHDNSEGIYWGCNTRGLANNTSGIPDPEDVGCTLRYNISQNDQGSIVFFNYSSAGNEIYNNIFHIKPGLSPNIIHENSGNNHTYNFYNNIIYNLGNGGYAFGSGTGVQTRTIQNNIFYGTHPSDEPSDINKLISNPLFVNPGAGTIGINSLLEGYKLLSGSPALSSGKVIASNGGLDFFDNSVSPTAIPNRGAYQGAAIVTTTPAPTANAQSFCALLNPTVANLVATGTALKWYANAIGGAVLATNTPLATTTYYVSQTLSTIESSRTAVVVTLNTTNPPSANAQVFCALPNPTIASLVADGTALKWYTTLTGGSVLATSTILNTGTYYVSQTLNSCESTRTAVAVTKNSTATPIASAQSFCALSGPTVASLVATGVALKWYSVATGGSVLETSTVLIAAPYYVSQTLNSCESPRTAVIVTLTNGYSYFVDADGDGYGSTTVVQLCAATAPSGYATNNTDCDDNFVSSVSEVANGIDDNCNGLIDEGITPPVPTVTSPINLCKGNPSVLLTAISIAGYTLKWYTTQTITTSLSAAPQATSDATKTYWVSQKLGSTGLESARTPITVNIIALPATPGTITTSDAVLCKHIGTNNQVTYTVPAVGSNTYNWTTTAGINIVPDTSATDNSITVNFLGAPTSNVAIGGIGTISVKSVSLGCESAASKALALTAKVPTAPTALTMTSVDSTPHFNLAVVPATIPATFNFVGLDALPKITKVGPYMGTNTVFTLTALAAPTAASYEWTLNGATQLSGGTSNEITVNFAGVDPGIGALPIVVKSVGGCGESIARTLTLSRALPTKPAALVLTALASTAITFPIATADKITRVSQYVDKATVLTLAATAVTVQGATATSYEWVFPDGVTPHGTNSTTVEGVTTISSTSNIITVDFEGVGQNVLSLPISVYAVNGTGKSLIRTLTLTSAAPATPGLITTPASLAPKFNPTCTTSTTITVQVPAVAGCTYAWTVAGETTRINSAQGTNSIVIDVAGVTTTTLSVSVVASNGTGISAPRTLAIGKTTTCGGRIAPEDAPIIAQEFNVIAHPNPSSDAFTLEVQSSDKGATGVQVYDMAGRLIESRQVKSNSVEVGRNYASGIYNVIVNKGTQVKTLRVVKR